MTIEEKICRSSGKQKHNGKFDLTDKDTKKICTVVRLIFID